MAQDKIHDAVKNALIKDGWTITDDSFTVRYKEITAYIDLAAEKTLAAEREGQKIAVEVKSFLSKSPMRDFENAIGQYRVYRRLLDFTEPERKLFLAISETAYHRSFTGEGIQAILREENVDLIVVNLITEEIAEWISH